MDPARHANARGSHDAVDFEGSRLERLSGAHDPGIHCSVSTPRHELFVKPSGTNEAEILRRDLMKRALWMFAAFWMVLTASLGAPSVGSAATLLKGRVLGPDGLPVTASVLAYKKDASGEWQFTGSAETDANGDYSFNFLGTGKFYFECDAYEECDPRVNDVRNQVPAPALPERCHL